MNDFAIPNKKGYEFKCCLCKKYFKVGNNEEHEEMDRIHAENLPEVPDHPSEICNNCYRDAEDEGHLDPSSFTH